MIANDFRHKAKIKDEMESVVCDLMRSSFLSFVRRTYTEDLMCFGDAYDF